LEYTFYLLGVQLGYATVKTLLDDSVRNCKGDFAAFRPTLIAGVPAIYEMIRWVSHSLNGLQGLTIAGKG
jgi:long-chain acyl-CoA synthetase